MLIKLARPGQKSWISRRSRVRCGKPDATRSGSPPSSSRGRRRDRLRVAISNPLGLHARAAARFVHAATAFQSRVRVQKGDQEMDGKSIMGLLLLAAARDQPDHHR